MPGRNIDRGHGEQPIAAKSGRIGEPEEFGEECGGQGGVPYRVFAIPPAAVRRVTVWHRQYIDGLQLATDEIVLPLIGSTGRNRDIRSDTFELASDDFITGITIEYWNFIDRITFHTNKQRHGPFGGDGGCVHKVLLAPSGRAVAGFAGRHWEFVDSIQLLIA